MFSTAYAEAAPWNDTFWRNERFNKLLVEARSELDGARRRELYVEMQRIIRDEGGAIIPLFPNSILAMNKRVQHGRLAANWDLDGFRGLERWWFD